MKLMNKCSLMAILLFAFVITGCKEDDDVVPEAENEEEVITDVKLIFTNTSDTTDIVQASAQDPDGVGIEELEILEAINLDTSKTYVLIFEITNSIEGEDIGAEIEEEAIDHQIFFSFSDNTFANPIGDGNIDNSSDPLVYNDEDSNGNVLGLSTNWTTPSTQLTNGVFTVRLQHQPDIKNGSSAATDGDTDFELQFVLNIQ